MPAKLKKRQRQILSALQMLGGESTTRNIAHYVALHTNGVSQSLGALAARGLVEYVSGKAGDTCWRIVPAKQTDS